MKSNRVLGAAVGAMVAVFGHLSPAEAHPALFREIDYASDVPDLARHTDPNLVNPWGIVSAAGLLWIANNGTDSAVAYRPSGQPFPSADHPLVIEVPGAPTGVAKNDSPSFEVSANGRTRPALLVFVTESGTIAAYHPLVDPTHAVVEVESSAVYKGVAVAAHGQGARLYAANFSGGVVEVYDGDFMRVGTISDPSLPDDYGPFNVAVLRGHLFVAFAKREPPENEEEVTGPGLGFVDEMTLTGTLVRRIAADGPLNAPWGLAIAPPGFDGLGGALLVGNFGDGRINAFDLQTRAFLGPLRGPHGDPISIDGLWGLTFDRGAAHHGHADLFFAAGIDDEAHGLFGALRPARRY